MLRAMAAPRCEKTERSAPSTRRMRLLRAGWLLLTALAVLLPAVDAFARAGGGEHYRAPSPAPHSSGGYSSGSGYHGSGGGGGIAFTELLFWIFRITFQYPLVMIPLWLFIAWMIYRSVKAQARQNGGGGGDDFPMSGGGGVIDPGPMAPRQNVHAELDQLKSRDPEFDPDSFFERTRKVFLDIQQAWSDRALDKARQYMSDGLFRRFTTLQAIMEEEGRRNVLADASVHAVRVVEVAHTEAFDCLSLRVEASMRDIDVPAKMPDELANKKAQSARMGSFAEVWTFVRRRDAKTRTGYDLGQGQCPNCGAPFTGGAANKCEYCGAIVNSGNYDWVLAEITQPVEYAPHRGQAPGLRQLLAADPNAATEVLRDRGLLVFWKWLECWVFSDPKRLQKLATPAQSEAIFNEIQAMISRGGKMIVRVPAVGGSDVIAVETNIGGMDRVHVDIRWSGVLASTPAEARAEPTPYRSVVTLVRQHGAQSDRGTGLSNERCGNCGAPLTNSDSTSCEYCNHDFTRASKEWQLESLVPYDEWQRPRGE